MTNPVDNQIAFSVKDAARATSLSETEIRRAIGTQELTAYRRGRKLLIMTEDLRAWLTSGPVAYSLEDREAQRGWESAIERRQNRRRSA